MREAVCAERSLDQQTKLASTLLLAVCIQPLAVSQSTDRLLSLDGLHTLLVKETSRELSSSASRVLRSCKMDGVRRVELLWLLLAILVLVDICPVGAGRRRSLDKDNQRDKGGRDHRDRGRDKGGRRNRGEKCSNQVSSLRAEMSSMNRKLDDLMEMVGLLMNNDRGEEATNKIIHGENADENVNPIQKDSHTAALISAGGKPRAGRHPLYYPSFTLFLPLLMLVTICDRFILYFR